MHVLPLAWTALLGACGGKDTTPATTAATATTPTAFMETCPDGTPGNPWVEGATGGAFGELVGDFTVDTMEGELTLSQAWTGCDSWVLLGYDRDYDYAAAWMSDTDPVAWLDGAPDSVHWLLASLETDPDRIAEDIDAWEALVEAGLAKLAPERADAIRARIHTLTRSAWTLGGGLGQALQEAGLFHLAVDRFQRLREVGFLSDPETGWTTTSLAFANEEVERFDLEARRAAEAAELGATEVELFSGLAVGGDGTEAVRTAVTVELPAEELAAADTAWLDLALDCGHPEYDVCSPHADRVQLFLCAPGETAGCTQELARLYTPYSRNGAWRVDISPLLALLDGEGPRTLEVSAAWPVTLDARLLLAATGGPRSAEVVPLWSGGTFGLAYNDDKAPVEVAIPADATRVEVVALISGEGGEEDANGCGEWCNHQHAFTVGDQTWLVQFPEAGQPYACAEAVPDGVVPNQYGAWSTGRGGWCPGQQVTPLRMDASSAVTPGKTVTVTYEGLYAGDPPSLELTDAWIEMSSWLVIER